MKLKVSFIEFLNAVPLGWGLTEGRYRDTLDLVFDVPSGCAEHLAADEVDVGLIPVIEYQSIEGLKVLPGISIGARREVKSVLFISRVPLEAVSRVAVDRSSRTSVALLKIILQEFYRKDSVEYTAEPPDPERMLERYDAALLIGNPALHVSDSFLVYDLAHEWYRFTGLPFVFAVWAVRPGVDLGDQAELFYLSRAAGLEAIDIVAQQYSERLGLPASEIRDYLNNLDYFLDDASRRGLETFFELAAQARLIPSPRPLDLYDFDQSSLPQRLARSSR